MSEMAQTATHLVVLGRRKLITEASVEDFTSHATTGGVLVRTPETVPSRLPVLWAKLIVLASLVLPVTLPTRSRSSRAT
jgi:ABC-2 type transport system ATP-binding protein